PTQVLMKVISSKVDKVRSICPEAPPELTAVAERALSRDRAQRYGSARELAAEIEAFQSGARVRAYEYSTWELVKRLVAKNKLAASLGAVAILVFLVATAVIWRAHRDAV